MYSPAYSVARLFTLLQYPASQMPPARLRTLTSNEMQDYLQTLAEPGSSSYERQFRLLFSYAEMRFKLHAGGRCALCQYAVRHLLAVTAQRDSGEVLSYQCLCNRCFQAERAICQKVTLRAGEAAVEYIRKPPSRKRRQSAVPWKELWEGTHC